MERESGKKAGHRRQSTTHFSSDNAVEEFKKVLIAKYGSLTRAWRAGLDPDENGQMDFREFCQALRSLGYTGNLRTLWYLLDEDYSGYVSLRELDPTAAAALEKFRAVSTAQFEDIPDMWRKVMDKDKSNSVSHLEFEEGAIELGYDDEEEIQELFKLLLLGPGARFISLDDIIFLQKWEETKIKTLEKGKFARRWVNRDPDMIPNQWKLKKEASRSSLGKGTDKESDAGTDYSAQVGIDWEEKKENFRKFLIKRYGSLPKAFEIMDANGSGELSMTEFQTVVATVLRYCRMGDAARLFQAFQGRDCEDDDNAAMTWQELGIPKEEWVTHRMQKQLERQKQAFIASLAVHAPLGRSPRMQKAERKHRERFGRTQAAHRWAFESPLPSGWGQPPHFMPDPPKPGTGLISLPLVPQSAR